MTTSPNASSRAQDNDGASSPQAFAGEVAQTASRAAEKLAAEARLMAGRQVDEVKEQAADRLGDVADAVRASGEKIRSVAGDTAGEFVEQAADRLSTAAGHLRTEGVGELISDFRELVRRQPVLMVSAAFVLGMIGARLLKSSPSGDQVR